MNGVTLNKLERELMVAKLTAVRDVLVENDGRVSVLAEDLDDVIVALGGRAHPLNPIHSVSPPWMEETREIKP